MKPNLLLLCLLMTTISLAQDQLILPFGSTWKYEDTGTNLGVLWKNSDYADATWKEGKAPLGYGTSGISTNVSFGPDPDDKHITTYFRIHFTIDNIDNYERFLLKLRKDDAALIFVNGQEVMRSNFSDGTISFSSTAYSTISGEEGDIIWEKIISTAAFQTGDNVIAVEVHQRDEESSDVLFDLSLIGKGPEPALYREPYLQKSTTSSAIVRWYTDVPTDSKLWYGENLADLTTIVESSALTTRHEIEITGLTADSKFYYQIGNSDKVFIGGTEDYFFKTNPEIGTAKPTRIWVTGDAGTGKDEQFRVRNAYSNFIGNSGKSDLWLMLGDNAYEHGREADYHMGLFTAYQPIMRNTVSFPVSGNHDMLTANAFTQTGTYFNIFSLPTNGECGGEPSGTEAYWSFDYGNIHCVALETYDLNIDSTGTMATWLKNDLEKTEADWLILYWHFPPYSKVSHDTDDPTDFSGRSTKMRRFINPIIERYGVDLVLSGHSHAYERSFLINGHYGFSNTLVDSMILDGSSGNLQQQTPYKKPSGLVGNKGTVYAVAGSSGKLSDLVDGESPHPAMYVTNTDASGSMVIDIAGDTLEAKFLNEFGIVQDYFHIIKGIVSPVVEQSADLDFTIFPNPGRSILNVNISRQAPLINGKLEFYSSDGRLVKSDSLTVESSSNSKVSFDISDLVPGIYTIKLLSNNQHVGSKLFVRQ